MMLNKSAIGTFMDCPFKYKVQFVDKVKFDKIPKALSKGIAVHKLLDEFYKPNVKNLPELTAEIRKHILYQDYKAEIENFINFNSKILIDNDGTLHKPIYRELFMKDEELQLFGTADAFFNDGMGWMLVDYKSGKPHTQIDEEGEEVIDSRYYLELAVYTMLFEKIKRVELEYWGIYFVTANQFVMQRVDRDVIEKVKETIGDVREQLNICKLQGYPKKPNKWCKYCVLYENKMCDGKI